MRFVQQIRLTFLFIYPAVALWLNKLPTSKYPDDVDHAVAGCQEDNLYLQCQNRFNKLNISQVFYGRDDTTICTSKVLESKKICNHTTPNTVIEKVKLMCSGENRCKIPVTPEFLEMKDNMICPDVRKYLKVFYTCRQNAIINEVCEGSCSKKCYPDCSESCCNPPSLTQTVTSSNYITSTCPGDCPQSCAPMCQPTCCQSSIALKTTNFCPNGCHSLCAPLCSPSCCLIKAVPTANLQDFRQPVPKLQYDVFRCDNGCNKACAPLCQPTCCESHRMLLQAAKVESPSCPSTCINSCNSNCPTHCCKSYHYPLPIIDLSHGSNVQSPEIGAYQTSSYYVQPPPTQSAYQKECASPCSPACAPYCTPGCCSGTEAQPNIQVGWCPLPCSATCAPACDSACCNPQPSSQEPQQSYQYVMPQQFMQAPQQYIQNPPIPIPSSNNFIYNQPIAPVYPVQPANPFTDISSTLGSQYMPYMEMPQEPSVCPIGCKSTCMNYCPQHCCRENASKNLYKTKEILQRKKYQQVLANFRAKQIQKYYQG